MTTSVLAGGRWLLGLLLVLAAVAVAVFVWVETAAPLLGPRARRGARASDATRRRFPAADEDYFHDMDGGVPLTPRRSRAATRGSSGPPATIASGTGSASTAYGALDFLKTMSSHPEPEDQPRSTAGSISAWSTSRASTSRPVPIRSGYGLWLDQRSPDCPPDPFENEQKYPGRRDRRARQDHRARLVSTATPPASSACGCFPIPTSTSRRRRPGTPNRYYTDPALLQLEHAGRPYRVGMSCGFCHVGPNPIESAGRSRTTRSGRTSAPTSARSTSGSTGSSTGTRTRRTSSSSCFTRRARARSTRR